MKLLFRRKHDGRILKPIQTLDSYVRLQDAAGNRVWWAVKDKLLENFEVLTHDIERGDVLRDIRDGQLWVVEHTHQHGLRLKSGILLKGMTYFGLINFERVGRKYSLRERQPRERATYDATKVQAKMGRAAHEIVNRFDAVTNAQRQAQEYGVGFIRVEPDGSMNAIDPRSVILK
ncbi:gp52 [Sodalis phage SO-1]|uniref:Gp52 n=1 Tax=Sodalis phage SO-1 TaxID=673375 RepID=C9EHE2_9CAUD|nr:gp52 [Sodalis phage SO1]ACV84144.1 gp52 [Sodalis phage SO1]